MLNKKKKINRLISIEFEHVGISPKNKGYKYLIKAIKIVINKPTANLCTKIGEKYNSVERAMQNAINRAWRTTDINDLLKYYTTRINSDKGVPTLNEFIYFYANKIKIEI